MKIIIKSILLLSLLICSFSAVHAQRGGGRNMDPQKMSERQTAMMTDSLALSDAQKGKITQVNLEYSKKMIDIRKAARENSTGDRSSIRTQMQTLRTEQKAELKKYLTAEQFEKWEKIESNRGQNRRGKGQRGDRRKKGDRKKSKKEQSSNEIN